MVLADGKNDVFVGDTDSSSGDEFDWEGGREGHNMRKEQRKIIREDINVLNEIFDTLEEKQKKEEEKERQEREAKEAEEREPTDVAGAFEDFRKVCCLSYN